MVSTLTRNYSELFFFTQKEVHEKKKRVKKNLDEQTLNNLLKKFNNKFPLAGETVEPGESEITLTARLEKILPTKPQLNNRTESAMSRIPSARSNANTFTDTRLQGNNLSITRIKFEYIKQFVLIYVLILCHNHQKEYVF